VDRSRGTNGPLTKTCLVPLVVMAEVNVKVVVRVRPQNKIETARGGKPCVDIKGGTEVKLDTDEEGTYRFTFDRIFGPDSEQKDVFDYIGRPVVDSIFKGYNGTIFAYGQTSSGKTHTMSGADGSIGDESMKGVIPRAIDYIFQKFSEAEEHIEFSVQTSFMEIYLERVKDLLDPSKTNLAIREEIGAKGIYVDGVTEEYVTSAEETLAKIEEASNNRVVAATGMNAGSSRSHSVAIIKVSAKDTKTGTTKNGKLCLVDLAGSEMVRKTGAKGQQLEEAKMINKSLSALGNVITALTTGKNAKHIPYRDSKLTRLLQESLGGNACTVMIICCSPSTYNAAETVSTLRFGNRAKSIKNVAKMNQTRSVEELTKLLMRAEKAIDVQGKYIAQLEKKMSKVEQGDAAVVNPPALVSAPPALPVPPLQASEQEDTSGLSPSPRRRERSGSLTAKHVEMEMKIAELEQRAEKAETELAAEREETKSLGTMCDEKDAAFQELEQQAQQERDDALKAKQKVQEVVEMKLEELQSLLDKVSSELELEREEAASLREMVDERDTKLTELENIQTKHVAQEAALSEMEEVKSQNESLRAKLESMAEKVAEAEASLVAQAPASLEKPNEKEPLSADLQAMVAEGALTLDEAEAMAGGKDVDSSNQVKHELAEANARLNMSVDALRNDLRNRCEKVIQLELALDKERDLRRLAERQGGKGSGESPEKQQQRKALQQRLEQLVMVHRQLLRKYATMELERERARKADNLKAQRITQLETNAKQIAKNMLTQSERHERDMRNLIAAKEAEISALRKDAAMAHSHQSSDGAMRTPPHSIRGGGHIVAGAGRPTIRGGEKTAVSKLASTEGDKTAASPGIGSFLSFFKMGK
jgi:kinesin family member 5